MSLVYKEDGKHCAFTDLAYYKDWYYLCFRVGPEHMFSKSYLKILKSKDCTKWELYSKTAVVEDIRDPRFLVLDKKLLLLGNYLIHEDRKVLCSFVVEGVVCEGYTKMCSLKNLNDWFLTSIIDKSLLLYDPVKGAAMGIAKSISAYPISIPCFKDSTESAGFKDTKKEDFYLFTRRDQGHNWWVITKIDSLDSPEFKIVEADTAYPIHCPTIFSKDKKNYLLGRETTIALAEDNWDEIWEHQIKLSMWEIKPDLKLNKIRGFEAHADCGYFGYANGFVSYYSNYDRAKPHETAIYVERL